MGPTWGGCLLGLALMVAGCGSGGKDTDPVQTDTANNDTPRRNDTGYSNDASPTVQIASPNDGSVVLIGGYDKRLGLWFADVKLQGAATDPEDGPLSGSSLVWTTDRDDIHTDPVIGTGEILSTELYSRSCGGATHVVTLTATDSRGNQSSASITLEVYQLC